MASFRWSRDVDKPQCLVADRQGEVVVTREICGREDTFREYGCEHDKQDIWVGTEDATMRWISIPHNISDCSRHSRILRFLH